MTALVEPASSAPSSSTTSLGITFQRGAKILQRIRLHHYAKIVFEREDFSDADPVNCLRIRQDNADDSRLYLSVFGRFFNKIHTRLRHCQGQVSLLHELILVDGGGNLGLGLAH